MSQHGVHMAGVRDLTEEDAHQQATNRWLSTGIAADLLNEGTLGTHDAQTLMLMLEDQLLYTHLAYVTRYAPEITVLNPDPKKPTLSDRVSPAIYATLLTLCLVKVYGEYERIRKHQPCRYLPDWMALKTGTTISPLKALQSSGIPSVDGMRETVRVYCDVLVKETSKHGPQMPPPQTHSLGAVSEWTGVGCLVGDDTLVARLFNEARRIFYAHFKSDTPKHAGAYARKWTSPLLLLSQYHLLEKDSKKMSEWCDTVSPDGFPSLDRYSLRELALRDGPDQETATAVFKALERVG